MSATQAEAIALRASGLRNWEIAERLGINQWRTCILLKGCGVPLPLIRYPKIAKEIARGPADKDRAKFMVAAYQKGQTLQQIGGVFGVTRERVRQILRQCGIAADLGGVHLRNFVRLSKKHRDAAARKAARIAKMEAFFGCCHDEVTRICGEEFSAAPWVGMVKHRRSPGGAYMNQRRNAETRKIGWEISLAEWWHIWQESGHWEQRGRGKGYCMARRGDSGPYSVNNVYICTIGQNFSDSYLVHPWHERFPNTVHNDPHKLSDLETAALKLRKDGLKIREIAVHLERPVGSVNWALSHGRAKVAAQLAAA